MENNNAAWTVMVYLAGDNNLTSECMFALTEMKKASLGNEINVIAQFDPSDPFLPTQRYQLNRSKTRKDLYYDIIDYARYSSRKGEVNFKKESSKANSLARERKSALKSCQALERASLTASKSDNVITDDTDTGSPVTLYNFIGFCIENYPADRYMVVLSGHAGGTERDYLLKDESSARSLTFNELKQVFKRVKKDRRGKPIDIVGMDNCLMSMGEICYELRGLVEVVVGSESFSPTSGWPYRQILERLSRDFVKPELPKGESVNEEAAKAIVDEYVNYYSTYWMSGMSVTQSALNVTKVEKLHAEVNKLAETMERELVKESGGKIPTRRTPRQRPFANSLLLAHWETQSYNGEQFVDVYDFCECLQNRVDSQSVLRQCKKVKEFIEKEFVLKSCYCGPAYQYSYGVSIYFPWAHVAPSYWNLEFVKDRKKMKGWGSFLATYTALTRRLPRGWNGAPRSIGAGEANVLSTSSLNNRMISDRMISDRMISDRMISDRMISDRMISDRMISDRMISDRMISDRMISDRMGSAGNRIHSMRNPPNMFLPDDCIKDWSNALEGMRILRLR